MACSPRGVCVLSQEEVKAFHLHGIIPNHKQHKHISTAKAINLVVSDLAYALEADGVNAVVEHLSNGYVWKSRMSAGYNVRQMVRLVRG
jgi:hypothetical protein